LKDTTRCHVSAQPYYCPSGSFNAKKNNEAYFIWGTPGNPVFFESTPNKNSSLKYWRGRWSVGFLRQKPCATIWGEHPIDNGLAFVLEQLQTQQTQNKSNND